jgi:NAD(P)-dependent dehydrogenase (short-subunit alcohol dehydrogenase family)
MSDPSPGHAVLVTGASTGIGYACVKAAIEAGDFVFALVRREEDAEKLERAFGAHVVVLIGDVTNVDGLRALADEVKAKLQGQPLHGLVCNAGIALAGPLMAMDLNAFSQMLAVNVTGLVASVQIFAPLMVKGGRIVLMSSVSGKVAKPLLAAYAASKHAVEAIGEGLRLEVLPLGLSVTVIGPGPIKTPIWSKGAGAVDDTALAGTVWQEPARRFTAFVGKAERKAPGPELVAHAVMTALTASTPPRRIAVVRRPLLNWVLPRLLPSRVIDAVTARALGLTPKS